MQRVEGKRMIFRCRNSRGSNRQQAVVIPREIDAAVLGANRVHDALCAPPWQRIGKVEIANSIIPARYVSGDFVTTFRAGGAWFVALGDLMGKGLSAAMWLTHTLDLVRRACEPDDGLPRILQRLNGEMHQSRIGVPLTALFLARVEETTGHINYACAGCPAAFVLRADGTVAVLEHGGPLLGALPDSKYEAGELQLKGGETLLAVSDGVTEIHRGLDFELRPERVVQHLREAAGKPVAELVRSLTERVGNKPFMDDVSILAMQHPS